MSNIRTIAGLAAGIIAPTFALAFMAEGLKPLVMSGQLSGDFAGLFVLACMFIISPALMFLTFKAMGAGK